MATPPFSINVSIPLGSDFVSQFPPLERTYRDVVNSWLSAEHTNFGFHDKVTFEDKTAAIPAGTASKITVFNDAGVLKIRNGTGTIYDFLLSSGIDNVAIGATTPATGAFTTLSATTTSVFTGIMSIGSRIDHIGDTDTYIEFGTDTHDFQTGGASRLDLSNSGVRFGAAGQRVTEFSNVAADDPTKAATVKAVFDAVAGLSTNDWQYTWHPYDMAALGDGADGIIHQNSVDGTVANVVTPDFDDGYDYQLRVFDFWNGIGGAGSVVVEGYLQGAAAYETAQTIVGGAAGSSLTATITFIEPRTLLAVHEAHYSKATVDRNDVGTSVATGALWFGAENGGWQVDTTDRLLRVRLSPVTGNITNDTNHDTIIKMYRRKNHT